jgi:hypothetical protein
LTDPSAYGAQLTLEARWEPVAFDDLPLYRSGGTDVTVAGRRGRFDVKPGQVMGRRGVELKDIDNRLALDLEQGTLLLRLIDGKAKDREGALAKLGELAVAKDGQLVAPPARDATLEALFPETIGGWRTLIRDLPYPADEFCRQCESGKALRTALKGQGKTVADVTMLSATAVDAENVIESAFNEPAIQAIRVAGGDASQLVEPVITYLFEGASAEPVRVDGDGIVAVSRPPDRYNFGWTAFVYPEGDTVWIVTSYGDVPTELLAALPGARTAPAVTAPRPTPVTDTSTPEGWARSTVPAEFRGEPVRVDVVPMYDDGSSTTKQLKRELKKQDKTIDDSSSESLGVMRRRCSTSCSNPDVSPVPSVTRSPWRPSSPASPSRASTARSAGRTCTRAVRCCG